MPVAPAETVAVSRTHEPGATFSSRVAEPTFVAVGGTVSGPLRCWRLVLVVEQVLSSTLPKMKSFSSAVNEDDEREWAHTSFALKQVPGGTRPEAVRSTAISENVKGYTAARLLMEPSARAVFSLSFAFPPGSRPQQGSVFALKQVLKAGLGVLPGPVDLSIHT